MLDVAHMIKLIRNAWEKGMIMKTSSGEQIKWEYVKQLVYLQEKEGLRLGNKLTRVHIEFHKQKMKVKLATQVFSTSVADSIEYLDKQMNHEAFKGSEATVKFLRLMNDSFDILNTRNPLGRGTKEPMNRVNFNAKKKILYDCEEFLLSIQNAGGEPMYLGSRKTGFIGWILSSRSFIKLHADLVLPTRAPLKYILGYKFPQVYFLKLYI